VTHWTDPAQGVESKLVIQVVQQAYAEERTVESLCSIGSNLSSSCLPNALFKDEDTRDAQKDRDEGGVGVNGSRT